VIKELLYQKMWIFLRPIIIQRLYDPILSSTGVAPTSQIHTCHAGITDHRKLKSTNLGKPPMAYCPYKMASKSVK
jgi:hypothetical protein